MADDKMLYENVNHESDFVFGINTTNKCYVLVPSKKTFEALLANFESCDAREWDLEVKVSDHDNTLNVTVSRVEELEKKMKTEEEYTSITLNNLISEVRDELYEQVGVLNNRIAELENKVLQN